MSRVLVTGSGGFIGRSVVSALSAGHVVVGFDDNSRHGGPGPVGDVRDAAAVNDAIVGCDAVWHLAAINGCRNFYERPAEVLDVQLAGTKNVIDACVRHGVKSLVLFSSSECYQTPPVIPTPEDVPLSIPDIKNPRYSYAIGKIAAEAMAWHSPIERVWTCRPHNVIGPDMGFDHVVPEFIVRMARAPECDPADGGPPWFTIQSDEETSRSFIHVSDFTDAVVKIWEHTEATPGKVREIYHVGTEKQTTIYSLAGEIARIMGRKFRWKTGQAAPGGTRTRCPDTRKVRALGWEPKMTLNQGLRATVEAYLAAKDRWPV
jgi:UDP-glucose 4-epimerase